MKSTVLKAQYCKTIFNNPTENLKGLFMGDNDDGNNSNYHYYYTDKNKHLSRC